MGDQGELKKLGVNLRHTAIANILRQAKIPPALDCGESPWHQLIKRHAQTLWACDFMGTRVWTPHGPVSAFVLVFIHPKSRRVIVSPATTKPDAQWVAEQAQRFAAAAQEAGVGASILIRDRDSKLSSGFDGALKLQGVTPWRLPYRCPNLNAHAERVIRTIQDECLDRFIVLGTRHLDYLITEYIDYYNRQRPHSAIGFRAPTGPPLLAPQRAPPWPSDIRCEQRLGGLIKHYSRRAA